jgi:orotate phosphoribosyltransferase
MRDDAPDNIAGYRELIWFLDNMPGGVVHSIHALKSGNESSTYFDFDTQTEDPAQSAIVVREFGRTVLSAIADGCVADCLAFIDKAEDGTIGALKISTALSVETGLPHLVVRPWKKIVHDRIKVRGRESIEGFRVIVVTDHCTTGQELASVCKELLNRGCEVPAAICFTYQPEYFDNHYFASNRIRFYSVIKEPELLRFNSEPSRTA